MSGENLDTPDVEETDDVNAVPYARFKEVNDTKNDLVNRLKVLEDAEEERLNNAKTIEEKRLVDEKEFETLLTQRDSELSDITIKHDAHVTTIASYEKLLLDVYDSRKSAVPEVYQPLLESMALVDRIKWIADNEEHLTTPDLQDIPKTPNGETKTITDEERRKLSTSVW